MSINKKLVIIINGKGGVGKDTLCSIAAKRYRSASISSITPVKELAATVGWKGEKDGKSRKFLSDLKKLLTEYNNYPTQYLLHEYRKFLNSDDTLLFVHIREKDQIEEFRKNIKEANCVTLLITRKSIDENVIGNASDDNVENFDYDYYFSNDLPLEETEVTFLCFIDEMLKETRSFPEP